MQKIRLLIADDSVFFSEMLKRRLSEESSIEIIGIASDGIDAISKIKILKPDVVTLDVEMPKLDGINLLRQLIPTFPVPVVVVSGTPMRAFDAIGAGAVDFIRKPQVKNANDFNDFIAEIVGKIKVASTAKVGVAKMPRSVPTATPAVRRTLSARPDSKRMIAIGASTGGTEAILEVIKHLPANSPGILVVQHMPAGFTSMYATRADKLCAMSVKEAQDGDRLEAGKIIIGAGDFHMELKSDAKGYYITSKKGTKVSGHCPSVDVLFDSVAKSAGKNAVGVILTGMGADGAKGLLAMKNSGSFTFGQDKDSSVVYGMPKVAFDNGAVKRQLPLTEIATNIIKYLNGGLV